MRKALKGVLVGGAVVTVALVGMEMPASASSHTISRSWGYATVNSNHSNATACDTAANNRGVRVEYVYPPGSTGVRGDTNGASGGCGSALAPDTIYKFRLCESNTGGGGDDCTDWLWIGDH
ncbi:MULTISPECIES: hypothetical protein [Micromonospora]|uniref:hypothetical protein n=1 Tax=Micromonospora TaxID=1873 RepID=UPI0021C75B7B|nr:hypothetical protein [Micromonospora sp. Mcm103]